VIGEREKLEFESLPEFVREPYSSARESYVPPSPKIEHDDEVPRRIQVKTAELEALWPGVNHDFLHTTRRSTSFYLTIGFMAGAVISLIGVWGYSLVSKGFVPSNGPGAQKVVMAGAHDSSVKNDISSEHATGGVPHATMISGTEIVTPQFNEYVVKSGDTLAGIASQAYKRVSPRLLDEICRANGMRSANVLSLGQKLVLPEYRTQATQLAGSPAGQVQ
jgi:LysM repeat protein